MEQNGWIKNTTIIIIIIIIQTVRDIYVLSRGTTGHCSMLLKQLVNKGLSGNGAMLVKQFVKQRTEW